MSAASAAELEQRLIDGDTTITREQIEKARDEDNRGSAWNALQQRAAKAKAERDQKAADDAGYKQFWQEFTAEHARFNGNDGELATAKDAVTAAVSALSELLDRKGEIHKNLRRRHEYYFARGYRPEPGQILSGNSLLWDRSYGGHSVVDLPHVQIKEAVEAALERN